MMDKSEKKELVATFAHAGSSSSPSLRIIFYEGGQPTGGELVAYPGDSYFEELKNHPDGKIYASSDRQLFISSP
jgi:hypothetical protein